jgi:ribosomal-protein-alanine N-acetyltransferase
VTPAAFADLLDRAYVEMRPWTTKDVAETLSTPHCVFLTRPNGGLIARIVAGECEILALATDPQTQRQGIASSLMSELFDLARKSNVDTVFLEVAARNTPARQFYATQGFAQIGTRRDYYLLRDGKKDDALMLSRHLGPSRLDATPTS